MIYSAFSQNEKHPHILVWNLQKHAYNFETGLRSDLTAEMIPLLNSMSMTEYTLQSGQTIPLHWHTDTDELCYILSGEFTLNIHKPSSSSSKYSPNSLTSGCAAFIPAGWLHEFIALKDSSRLLSIYNTEAPHLITAIDAWNKVLQEELHGKSESLPVQPVFSRFANSTKAAPESQIKRSSHPAPPLLRSRSFYEN